MRHLMKRVAFAALGGVLGGAMAPAPAPAENVALVIGNQTYLSQPAVPGAAGMRDAVVALRGAGFRVLSGQNLTSGAMAALASRFRAAAKTADRVVIVLAGHLVSTSRDSWLLGADAVAPDGLNAGAQGLSLGAVMDIAAAHPGGALVAIAPGETAPRIGAGLKAGLGNVAIAQGVTLVRGPAAGLVRFLARDALFPGQSLGTALKIAPPGVTGGGFMPPAIPFLPPEGRARGPDSDTAYWQAVQAIGTIEALQTYRGRYPAGRHLAEADRLIAALRAAPGRRARTTEDSLRLSREARRQIQRNLSILEFDPHGVDGIFGRGTRTAITGWQRRNGFDETGYLSRDQITALQAGATARARALEQEAGRRQQEQDRQDAIWWRQSGRDGTETGLQNYLARYPDGLYSGVAKARLDAIEAAKRQQSDARERALWDQAEAAGTQAAYRQYLATYPDGAFAEIARIRLADLAQSAQNDALRAQARTEEARVAGNPVTRLLIENRLRALGLKPGRVDGVFDPDTRRALRKFQKTRQIPVTGFVTQQTLVRLLAAR